MTTVRTCAAQRNTRLTVVGDSHDNSRLLCNATRSGTGASRAATRARLDTCSQRHGDDDINGGHRVREHA